MGKSSLSYAEQVYASSLAVFLVDLNMKLEFSSTKDDSLFILTDFNCASSLRLLKDPGLYKIIWSRDHPVRIKVDGYNLSLDLGQVLFCTPINILQIEKNTAGLISLVFNREFYCIRDHDEEVSCNGFLFFGSSHLPVITLSKKQKASFAAILHLFEEEFEIMDQIQGEMLRVLLKRMLIMSRRILKEGISVPDLPDAQLDTVRKFNLLVEKHFKEMHQVSDYADLLFKSPKTLANVFGKYSAKSPLQVINERILLEAKRLLLYSDKTSEEIAYQLGYKDASHFSRFFKKNEGQNPTEFRKSKITTA